MKARILYQSHTDDITLTATSAAMAAANLQSRDVQAPWRSTDLADQQITAPLGQSRDIGGVSLENVNLTSAAWVVAQFSDDDFATIKYAEPFQRWLDRLTHHTASLWLSGDSGGDRLVDANGDALVDANGDHLVDHRYTSAVPVAAEHVRLVITDPGNADGYMEAGRLKAGPYIEEDLAAGPRWTRRPLAALRRMRGGGWRSGQEGGPVEITVQLGQIDEDGAFDLTDPGWADMLDHLDGGPTDDVVLAVYPGDGGDRERRHLILGRVISHSGLDEHSTVRSGASAPIKLRSRLTLTVSEGL